MPHYIEFDAGGGESILVEVDAQEVTAPAGVEKAGLRDVLGGGVTRTVATAEVSFSDAVEAGVERVARGVEGAVSRLAVAPAEVEVTFGLKATGESGNIAIGKAGAEANIEVRLKWMQAPAKTDHRS